MQRRLFTSLFLGAILCLPPTLPAEEAPQPIRVLSFNLRFANAGDKEKKSWEVRAPEAVRLIKQDQPDLIGYQEALRSMLDELAGKIEGYEEIGVGRDDGKTKGEYSPLWIKKDRFTVEDSGTFWLSETPEVPNSKSWGNQITRICTWARLLDKSSGQTVHFYNVHLDHQSQEARLKGTQQVLKHMETRTAGSPWIFTGDFNAGEDNPVVKAITEGPLKGVDSWRRLNPAVPAAESGTFHNFRGNIDSAKIDFIFVPPAAKLIDAAIMRDNRDGIYPSDHYPVRATVQFPR